MSQSQLSTSELLVMYMIVGIVAMGYIFYLDSSYSYNTFEEKQK